MTQEAELELEPPQGGRASSGVELDIDQRLQAAIAQATDHLLSLQAPEGYWAGELQADSTLESDYIFFLHVIGEFDPRRIEKLARYIRRRQREDGGWNTYVGGASELNATVKAYVGLLLAGDSPEAPHMLRARSRIHELGGLENTNSYTRFYLALGGALDWKYVPAIPPELMILPSWFPLNIYSVSSWTRAIVAPLTILYELKPAWPIPAGEAIYELFRGPSHHIPAFDWDRSIVTWRNFFLGLDRLFKLQEALPWKPFRKAAKAKSRQWLIEHLERTDGLAAIFPAMVNSVFALVAMGYPSDDPLTVREIGHLRDLEIEDEETIRLQPCVSPVWDTAIVMNSLMEAGLPADHPALIKAAHWLLNRQVVGPGDWQVRNPDGEPGGWVFEFRNDFYPDVDDTAFVLMALRQVAYPDRARMEHTLRRGVRWLLSMQNRDGGWGAFDRDNDHWILTRVPFADHNAMIDPSTEDVTSRVLECLGRFGWPASHPTVQHALEYLWKTQTSDGAWYGRWGVNYVYGTSGVLRMLEVFGLEARSEVQRAVQWLQEVQNADGGFGETCASYDDPSLKGRGPSTASQTAWALIGMLAAGNINSPSVARAVQYLVENQKASGGWEENMFTGTGFPRVFYLCYHLYRDTFPLYALARHRNLRQGETNDDLITFSPAEFPSQNGGRKRNRRLR